MKGEESQREELLKGGDRGRNKGGKSQKEEGRICVYLFED